MPAPKVRKGRSGEFVIRVHNRDSLRELISATAKSGEVATRVRVVVAHAVTPRAGWMGNPDLALSSFSACWTDSGFEVSLQATAPQPLAILLAGALRSCTPTPGGVLAPKVTWDPVALPVSGNLAEIVRHIAAPAGFSGDANPHLRETDRLIDSEFAHVVNPLVHRPTGRRSDSAVNSVAHISLDLPESLDAVSVHKLRAVSSIADSKSLSRDQRIQLQACGVNLDVGDVDARESQFLSVARRNLALREHSPIVNIFGWPSVSMLLVTNRENHLHAIVEMLAKQTYPNLELVLLTHGFELDDHIAAHFSELSFPALTRSVPGELNLGEVLTVASSLASGELITKIDDDDFYGPEHVWDIVVARMYSGAEIVGKALDNIYLASENVTVFRPNYAAEKYAKFVAGGTMLISQADLRAVGGWRPVPKSVDLALIERVTEHGGLIYRMNGHGYIYVRHAQDSTAANTSLVSDAHFRKEIVSETAGVDTRVLRGYSEISLVL